MIKFKDLEVGQRFKIPNHRTTFMKMCPVYCGGERPLSAVAIDGGGAGETFHATDVGDVILVKNQGVKKKKANIKYAFTIFKLNEELLVKAEAHVLKREWRMAADAYRRALNDLANAKGDIENNIALCEDSVEGETT